MYQNTAYSSLYEFNVKKKYILKLQMWFIQEQWENISLLFDINDRQQY